MSGKDDGTQSRCSPPRSPSSNTGTGRTISDQRGTLIFFNFLSIHIFLANENAYDDVSLFFFFLGHFFGEPGFVFCVLFLFYFFFEKKYEFVWCAGRDG